MREIYMTSLSKMAPATNSSLPESGYIRMAQLVPAIIPVSSATLWRKVKAGTFPAPVKLGPRTTAWKVDSVREWLRNPIAE